MLCTLVTIHWYNHVIPTTLLHIFLLFCLMKMHAYNSSALVLFILIIYWHPIVFTFVRLINISSCTSNVILLIYLQFPLISYFSVWTKANHLTGLKVDENGLNVQNILMAWFVCDSKKIYVWPTHIMYSNKVSWSVYWFFKCSYANKLKLVF